MANLRDQRRHERCKYLELKWKLSGYGASNHGKGALGYIQERKPKFVVDFGCGRNNFILSLRELGLKGKGIDFAYDEADVSAPMHKVPLEDSCADLITAFDSLEHLLPEEVDEVFKEMRRIATPNARFVFSISYRPSNITAFGEGLHPTVREEGWWIAKINKFASVKKEGVYLAGKMKVES